MNPFPFQLDDLDRIDLFKGKALLAAEPGLGKTATALLWLKRHPEALPAVVVCPASIKWFWESECLRWTGLRSLVIEGRSAAKIEEWSPLVLILNYDILVAQLPILKRFGARTIVIDESQMIGNGKTHRTKAVKELCRGVPNVLALSGTPMVNRPIELWPVLSLLAPKVFRSKWDYATRYCGAWHAPWGWDFRGATHLDELHELLSDVCMIRHRTADVLPDLPENVREVVPLPMADGSSYAEARDDFLGWLARENPLRVAKAKRAEALVKMNVLLQLAARGKFRAAVEWINRLLAEDEGKMVIFATHRGMVEALERRCEAESVVVDGSVTGRKRQEAVDRFQGSSKVRLLIGNIQAAGIGLTLTASRRTVHAELAWRPGDHTQAEKRVNRIGTTGTTFSHYLVAHGTIEEDLCELIQAKQVVLSAALDGGPTPGDLDVFDLLLRKLGRGLQQENDNP